ncbi:MAG: hypothetical protein JO043_07585 [Candidatus Eremiobacteraeota bacterium]|nr:hypothetical protein [Candidatus Eremiobacteraeota bacterium]
MNRVLAGLRSTFAALSVGVLAAACGGPSSTAGAIPVLHTDASIRQAASSRAASRQKLLYLSIGNTSTLEVDVYPADITIKNPKLIRKITDGLTNPGGLWVDKAGTLYVVNSAFNGPGNVVEYAAGSAHPTFQIPKIPNAQFVTVDKRGFVYVSGAGNFGNNSNAVNVFVFAPHSTKLVRTVKFDSTATTYDAPSMVALDSKGDIFVGQNHRITKDFQICMAKAGATEGTLFIDRAVGDELTIDGSDNLYVADAQALPVSTIEVYPPGSNTPSRSMSGGAALAAASDGTLYAGYGDASEFDEYAPGASSPTNSFTYGTYGLRGSAIAP